MHRQRGGQLGASLQGGGARKAARGSAWAATCLQGMLCTLFAVISTVRKGSQLGRCVSGKGGGKEAGWIYFFWSPLAENKHVRKLIFDPETFIE